MGITQVLNTHYHHCKEMDIRSEWKIDTQKMYDELQEFNFTQHCLWCGEEIE